MTGEVIQRRIEAPRRLPPTQAVDQSLAILLLADASVPLDRVVAQGNGPLARNKRLGCAPGHRGRQD